MRMSTPTEVAVPKEHEGTREISLAQAVNEALAEELRRDPTVVLIGEDVAEAGTPFKVTSGLVEEFGPERVLDSPISEAGITGIGLGASMTGMRPVVDIMFGDFLTLVMDQLANQAAKAHYMSGGRLRAPLTVRTTLVASAKKTGRVLVVDEGHRSYGASAELAATVAEDAFYWLDAPVRRAAAMDVPVPFSPVLEDETVPTPDLIVEISRSLLGKA